MPPKRLTSTPDGAWQETTLDTTPASAETNLIVGEAEGVPLKGFGGCFNELGWVALQALKPADRETILDLLFSPGENGLHLEVGRLPMGASDYAQEWHSYDETDGDLELKHFSLERDRQKLFPYVNEALRRNPKLTFFASPWSPPTWMKTPRAYNFGKLRREPAILDAYARYFSRYVKECQNEGVTIAQVHVQNEPLADQKFPSCLWTGPELRDFIRDYLGPVVAEQCPGVEVWLGTINAPFFNYSLAGLTNDGITQGYDQYAGLVLADPQARRHIAGVGYQWGGKNAIERTHESWPQLRLMQTENECGDGQNSWAYAHYVFNLVRHYFKHGVEAYVYWNMVLPDGGASTWGWNQNSMISVDLSSGTYRLNPEFHLFRHITQFLKPGAIRRRLSGEWTANTLAFENTDGSTVVIAANPYDHDRTLTIKLGTKTHTASVPAQAFETFVFPAS
jgi:glucosylceramidase